MIIERDKGLKDKIHLTFRYGCKKEELFEFVSKRLTFSNIAHRIRRPNEWSIYYAILIDDLENTHFDPYVIKSINEELCLSEDMFDFFLGITSAYQFNGFMVPQNVVEYIRIIGGSVEVSYACSYDAEKDYPPSNLLS